MKLDIRILRVLNILSVSVVIFILLLLGYNMALTEYAVQSLSPKLCTYTTSSMAEMQCYIDIKNTGSTTLETCKEMRMNDQQYRCMMLLAKRTQDPSVCWNIGKNSTYPLREDCIRFVNREND